MVIRYSSALLFYWLNAFTTLHENPKSPVAMFAWVKADICSANRHVRFTPRSGHVRCKSRCLLWAKSGHAALYSIASLALCCGLRDLLDSKNLTILPPPTRITTARIREE